MKKKYTAGIAAVLAAGLIAFHFSQIHDLKRQLEDLKNQELQSLSALQSQLNSVQSSLSGQQAFIEEQLSKQASILASSDVRVQAKENQLRVTISAVPKELSAGEQAFARLTDGQQSWEEELDSQGNAVFTVPITETLTSSVLFRSETGLRQETLEELHVSELLAGAANTSWNDADVLRIDLFNTSGGFSYGAEELTDAAFLILDSSLASENAAYWDGRDGKQILENLLASAAEVPASPALSPVGNAVASFSADLSPYLALKDSKQYQVYFTVRAKDGPRFLSDGQIPVASFFSNESSSHQESGSDTWLYPVFE